MELQKTVVVPMKQALQLTVLLEQLEVVFPTIYDTVDSTSLKIQNCRLYLDQNIYRQGIRLKIIYHALHCTKYNLPV